MMCTINGKEALPVGRPDFKPGVGRLRSCVGSTPTPFRPLSANTYEQSYLYRKLMSKYESWAGEFS